MWVFDGEEWHEEGVRKEDVVPTEVDRDLDELRPELQVIEVSRERREKTLPILPWLSH